MEPPTVFQANNIVGLYAAFYGDSRFLLRLAVLAMLVSKRRKGVVNIGNQYGQVGWRDRVLRDI